MSLIINLVRFVLDNQDDMVLWCDTPAVAAGRALDAPLQEPFEGDYGATANIHGAVVDIFHHSMVLGLKLHKEYKYNWKQMIRPTHIYAPFKPVICFIMILEH